MENMLNTGNVIFFLLKSNIKHVRNEGRVAILHYFCYILCFVPEFLPLTMFALSGTFHIAFLHY